MTTDDRVWELKQAMKVKTFVHQQDMRKEVLDIHIPQGFVCVNPPEKAVALLRTANVALDSLFANIRKNEEKYKDYLHHIHGQARSSYVDNRTGLGYIYFNFCSHDDYARHGRLSAPRDLRGFWKSESEFEVLDQFLSSYMKKIAQYCCGSVDVTSDDISHIEQLINDRADMTIMKYDDKQGIQMHLDSMIRGNATVFTIGVGRDVVYDMSRAIGRNKGDEVSIVRSSNPEGTMMVLDGESRYKWTHGIPHSREHNGTKYTIHISFFHAAGLTKLIGRCEELDTNMYSASAYTRSEPETKTPSNENIGAQHDSLLGLLMQLEQI